METIYYTATEAAKMLRAELKVKFPEIKFSVRKTSSSCIWVTFSASHATGQQVNAIAQNFSGASFDGMTDSESNTYHELNGDRVHFGSRYIFLDVDTKNHPCGCELCKIRALQNWAA